MMYLWNNPKPHLSKNEAQYPVNKWQTEENASKERVDHVLPHLGNETKNSLILRQLHHEYNNYSVFRSINYTCCCTFKMQQQSLITRTIDDKNVFSFFHFLLKTCFMYFIFFIFFYSWYLHIFIIGHTGNPLSYSRITNIDQ